MTCAGAAGKLGAEHLTGVAAAVRKARGLVRVQIYNYEKHVRTTFVHRDR